MVARRIRRCVTLVTNGPHDVHDDHRWAQGGQRGYPLWRNGFMTPLEKSQDLLSKTTPMGPLTPPGVDDLAHL